MGRFYRNINELRREIGMPPINCPCDPVAEGIRFDGNETKSTPITPSSATPSPSIAMPVFSSSLSSQQEPHPRNSIFLDFPLVDSSSLPLWSTSSAPPTQGSSGTKSGSQSSLSSSFKGELQQSVHPFKKNLEERATGKGEFSIFNHQDLGEKVAFSESDSPVNALCVSLGSFLCLEVNEKKKEKLEAKTGAHKLFDKLSEPILPTKVTSGDILGKSRIKELQEFDFVSLIFYPGGEKHKRKPNDCDGILIYESGVVSNACKVFTEVLEPTDEVVAEFDELLPQCESYTPLVFDLGGGFCVAQDLPSTDAPSSLGP